MGTGRDRVHENLRSMKARGLLEGNVVVQAQAVAEPGAGVPG